MNLNPAAVNPSIGYVAAISAGRLADLGPRRYYDPRYAITPLGGGMLAADEMWWGAKYKGTGLGGAEDYWDPVQWQLPSLDGGWILEAGGGDFGGVFNPPSLRDIRPVQSWEIQLPPRRGGDWVNKYQSTGLDLFIDAWVRITQFGTVTLDANDWRGRIIWYNYHDVNGTVAASNTADWGPNAPSGYRVGAGFVPGGGINIASGTGAGDDAWTLYIDDDAGGKLKLRCYDGGNATFDGEFQVHVCVKTTKRKTAVDFTI